VTGRLALVLVAFLFGGPAPAPPPSGSYPPNTPSVWGHLHPTCPTVSGTCATSVGTGGTIENCNATSEITVTGNDATIQCVLATGIGPGGLLNFGANIRNLTLDRVTFTGLGLAGQSELLKISSTKGTGYHTVTVTKSVFKEHRLGILLGGGKLDKDSASVPGYPGYAFVARENIFVPPVWDPTGGPHVEQISIVETMDGGLFQYNTVDCDGSHNSNNPCNTAHVLAQPHSGGAIQNITFDGNRWIGDTAAVNGFDFTLDEDHSAPGNCVDPLDFTNNVIEQSTTSTFNLTGCPSMASRGTCTGNTLNGSTLTESGCS
jgi:hypothetical protein